MTAMSELGKCIREFEQNAANAAQAKVDRFSAQVAPALPIAILFCNKDGQANADAAQIMALFEGGFADRYNTAEDEIDGFEFINYLAEYVGVRNDVVFVTNAKASGFEVLQLMQYFEHQYYITTIEQAQLLNKLRFVLEEQKDLEGYARQTSDKAWELYDVVRSELIANGFGADEMESSYKMLTSIEHKEDRLRVEIMRLIDGLSYKG